MLRRIRPHGATQWGLLLWGEWAEWSWNVTIGGTKGTAQGVANLANVGTDAVIGVANTPGLAWNFSGGWFLPNVPYIPSPDWSNDLITSEGDTLHAVSKSAGEVALTALLAAEALETAAARRATAGACSKLGPKVWVLHKCPTI